MAASKFRKFFRGEKSDLPGWALIFFFGALVILAEIVNFSSRFTGWNGWSVFFTGFGIIVLIWMIIYLIVGRLNRALVNAVFGLILITIGLGNFFNIGWIWVIILVIIGIAILRGMSSKKK